MEVFDEEPRSFWRLDVTAALDGVDFPLVGAISVRDGDDDDDDDAVVFDGVAAFSPSSASIRLLAALVRIPAPAGSKAVSDFAFDD